LNRLLGLAILGCWTASCAPSDTPDTPAIYTVVDDTIPAPLTGKTGDPDRGQAIFQDRETGHCVLCHQIEGLPAEFQGDVGPDLTFVAERLSPEQIRLRIVDYGQVLADVTMPSYYRIHDLHQVGREFEDQTVLTADQIEDLVAFLSEQKEEE
tara:strand:+ start:20975 stop:21433 length:459 start_codon:yes stop_codon:yes gene_type:complete